MLAWIEMNLTHAPMWRSKQWQRMEFFTEDQRSSSFQTRCLVPMWAIKTMSFPQTSGLKRIMQGWRRKKVKGEEVGLAISASSGSWKSSHPVSQVKKQELKEGQYHPLGHTAGLGQSHWRPVTRVLPAQLPTAPQTGQRVVSGQPGPPAVLSSCRAPVGIARESEKTREVEERAIAWL